MIINPYRYAGVAPVYTDEARSGTASIVGSAYQVGTYPPSYAIDGDDGTSTFPDGDAGKGVRVDLLAAKTIVRVRVKQGSSPGNDCATWSLQSSPDSGTWTQRATGGSGVTTTDETIDISAVTARYWRVIIVSHPGGWAWPVFTFSLFSVA